MEMNCTHECNKIWDQMAFIFLGTVSTGHGKVQYKRSERVYCGKFSDEALLLLWRDLIRYKKQALSFLPVYFITQPRRPLDTPYS